MVRFQHLSCLAGMALTAQTTICAAGQLSLKAELEYSFANNVGLVVGAAIACPDIDRARIRYVNDMFTDFFKSSTSGDAELREVKQLYENGTADGQREVTSLSTDCARAGHDLADWESIIKESQITSSGSASPGGVLVSAGAASAVVPATVRVPVDIAARPAQLAGAPLVTMALPRAPLVPENLNRKIFVRAGNLRSYVRQALFGSALPALEQTYAKPSQPVLARLAYASRFGAKYVVPLKHKPLHRRRRRWE